MDQIKSEEEWCFMNKTCEECVNNRLGCLPAKQRLFKELEIETSTISLFRDFSFFEMEWSLSKERKERFMAEENWESFVRLSCRCFPVFKNLAAKQDKEPVDNGQQDKEPEDKGQGDETQGEGPYEKQLASLFDHYAPYFYPSYNKAKSQSNEKP